ncbi:hypothetical protein STEG23_023048 [Scotinomys teguina]
MFTQPWSTAIRRTEKSESSDSEYVSEEEQKPKDEPEDPEGKESTRVDKEAPATKKKIKPKHANPVEVKEEVKSNLLASQKADPAPAKDKTSPEPEKESVEKGKPSPHPTKDKLKAKVETDSPTVHLGLASDSESELVIVLGEDPSGQEGRKNKKEPKVPSPKQEAIGSPVKKQRLLLPKETAPAVQRVEWNSTTVQQKETFTSEPIHFHHQAGDQHSASGSGQQFWLCKHPGIRYQCPSAIATASANVAADIAEYTSKMMDAIKGTMMEIYNDLSKTPLEAL